MISVVIPTRNRRRFLARTLRTALEQRDVAVEAYVVDDASEDDTAAFVNALRDRRVTLLRHETQKGVAVARNTGLACVRSPWVAFLDDDDLWAPNKLALQLDAAARAGADWVLSGAVTVDEAFRIIAGKPPPRTADDLVQVLGFNLVPGGGSGSLVRTELARAVGGFDSDLSVLADWDMWIRLSLAAAAASVHRPLVASVRHDASLSRLHEAFTRDLARIEAKHRDARFDCGVELHHDRWLLWAARMHLRSGRRHEACKTYLEVASRYGDRKSLVRAAAAFALPSLTVHYWNWHGRRLVSRSWLREAKSWLAPLRTERALRDASRRAA